MSTQDPTTTTYTVSGMTCAHCVASVTEEVGAVPGVTAVDVDLASGLLTVGGDVSTESVRGAVEEAGYALAPAPGEPRSS